MNDQNTSARGGEIEESVGAVESDAIAWNASVALHVPATQKPVPKTILVVDDELHQLTKSHVHRLATNFYDTIADVNDPIFEDLWAVAKSV